MLGVPKPLAHSGIDQSPVTMEKCFKELPLQPVHKIEAVPEAPPLEPVPEAQAL